MRAIHLAQLDKTRPVLVLTRELLRPHLTNVTIAPITSRVRGLSTEVLLDESNGVDRACAVSCDNITTIPKAKLGRLVGYLYPAQEAALTEAISIAFDLEP
jgi:mRNA interferase MazF